MNFPKNIFRNVFGILFTIVVWPIFLLLLSFFAVYRKCVDFILKKKIGDKYGGLLSGGDQFFALEREVTKTVVNVLLMVDSSDEDFSTTAKRCFKTRFFDDPETLPKFTGVCKQAFGYFYVLKDSYGVDECVREVKEEVRDERDLQEVFSKYANLPLPKNHTVFWETLIFKNAIEWRNSKKCYPIIVRCNHTMGDGTNLLYAFWKFLNDDPLIQQAKPIVRSLTKLEKILTWMKKLVFQAYIMLIVPSFILFNIVLKKGDSNWFQNKTLSRKTTLTWKIDDEMITKVKKIKNKTHGTTFTDVLITAVSASYEEHMTKSGLEVPENFTFAFPISFNPPDYYQKSPILINNLSGLLMSTPIRWNSNKLVERLKEVGWRRRMAKKNFAIHAYYWLFTVLPNYLPLAYMKPQIIMPFTMALSNNPSVPHWMMFGGQVVDIVTYTSHVSTGMSLVFINYGGGERMQMGFSVDRTLISSLEEMNNILDGVVNCVNSMYLELSQK